MASSLVQPAADPVLHSFKKIRLSDKFWAEGANSGDLNRDGVNDIIADLRAHQGREIFIRGVDEATTGWGHVNFDDFKFLAERPEFASELKPKK